MVSVLHTNLISCRVGSVLSCFYKSNFSSSLLVARTVQPFFLLSFDLDINTRSRIEIRVFLLATERIQIGSVYFDPLLLEARGVFFLESISGKILALSFLEEFEDSSLRAQSFRTLPLKTGVDIRAPS